MIQKSYQNDYLDENNERQLITQNSLEKKKKRCCEIPIHCDSNFRLGFDFLVILLSVYNCVMIPIEISFGLNMFTSLANQIISVLDRCIDFIFLCDITLNFLTTFFNEKDGTEIRDLK